jgi:hypothetical protein
MKILMAGPSLTGITSRTGAVISALTRAGTLASVLEASAPAIRVPAVTRAPRVRRAGLARAGVTASTRC